jgi:ABC-type nitrate/sulfonate/bicarbonate transport system substrate-binding protein
MLNLIEKFPMTARTPLNVHRAVEVLKFGFAARLVMTKDGSPRSSAEPLKGQKSVIPHSTTTPNGLMKSRPSHLRT